MTRARGNIEVAKTDGNKSFPVAIDEGRLLLPLASAACASAPRAEIAAGLSSLSGAARMRADLKGEMIALFEQSHRGSGVPLREAANRFAGEFKAGRIPLSIENDEARKLRKRISGPTILRWRRQMENEGAARLAGNHGAHRRGTGLIERTPELASWLIEQDLRTGGRVSFYEIAMGAAAEFNVAAPSLSQVRRFLNRFRAEKRVEREHLLNPDRARSRFMPAFGNASAGITEFLQRVELDGSPSDLVTLSGTRRRLLFMTDVFTRLRWALVAPSESSEATGRLLAKVFTHPSGGVPAQIGTDNGSGFISRRIRALLHDLDIDLDVALPYRGDLKPFAESTVHYVQQRLAMLPGYTGRDVAQRQEIRGRLAMANRRGKSEAEILNVQLTDDELQEFLDDWLATVDANRPRSGLKNRSPNDLLREWVARGGVPRRLEDQRALFGLMLRDGETRKVGKEGIAVDGALYCSSELGGFIGEDVQIGRHFERGKIVVWGPGGDLICVATDVEMMEGGEQREIALAAKGLHRARISAFRKTARRLLTNNSRPLHEAILDAAHDHPAIEVPAVAFENAATRAALAAVEALDEAPARTAIPIFDLEDTPVRPVAIRRARVDERAELFADWNRYERLRDAAPIADEDRAWMRNFETTEFCRSQRKLFAQAS
jgi:transposase InsO family protein